jgi:hypothetical protein
VTARQGAVRSENHERVGWHCRRLAQKLAHEGYIPCKSPTSVRSRKPQGMAYSPSSSTRSITGSSSSVRSGTPCRSELGREPELDRRDLLPARGERVALLAPAAPALRPEVVERHAAADPAEPRPLGAAPRVETAPGPERLLERLGRQLLGERRIGGEHEQVTVHGIEVVRSRLAEAPPEGGPPRHRRRERVHASHTAPGTEFVTCLEG